MRVVAYCRVSTADQLYGIAAQRSAIAAEAERRGWEVVFIEDAGKSGKDIDRPGIQRALGILKRGDADALVVSKLDRLSRSLADFARVLETSAKQGWGVLALDLGIDTTTPTGQLVANIMAAVAQWERQVIGQRTKDGLAEARKRGVHIGGRVNLDPATEKRIVREYRQGRTLTAIARSLNDDLTPRGGSGRQFYPSTVRAVLSRQ